MARGLEQAFRRPRLDVARPVLVALAFLLVAGAGAARAEDPCADDARRLCSGVKLGGGRVSACLRAHQASLGEACRARVEEQAAAARRLIQDFGVACKADVDRYCATVEPGDGKVIGCLSQHQLEVSRACQGELARIGAARDAVAAFRSTCASEVERLCAGVAREVGPLLECIEEKEDQISAACRATDFRAVGEAAALVDLVDDITRKERVREALEILQGLDTVAFARSQVLVQFDSFQSIGGKGNGGRMLLNPQFVFGERNEFALQVKLPISGLFPYAAGAPTQFGLGAVSTAFAWNFDGTGRFRQYAALGIQWQTASTPIIGGPWAVVPSYAIGTALTRWLTLTAQVQWIRSMGGGSSYPELNVLIVEPIVAASLPGRSWVALDTRLGWDFANGTLLPLMKGVVGIFTDRQKSLSISAWYQAALSQPAADLTYKYEVGAGLAWYFDW